MAKKYVGDTSCFALLKLIYDKLKQKQDLLNEITADETQAMWDGLNNNDPTPES